MNKSKGAYRILVGKSEGKNLLINVDLSDMIILHGYLRSRMRLGGGDGLD